MNEQKMREEFEAWYGEHYSSYALKTWNGKSYDNLDTQLGWASYQAALSTKQQAGEPVAWLIERHAFRVSPHGQDAEGHDWLEVTNDGEADAFPVYTAPQLLRDVLMRVAEAVRDEVKNSARAEYNRFACEDEVVFGDVDLATIVDAALPGNNRQIHDEVATNNTFALLECARLLDMTGGGDCLADDVVSVLKRRLAE